MNYLKVPLSRVGAVIGPKGKTKRKLEQLSGCKLLIESDEGIIEISEQNMKDPLKGLQLISAARAIGRGFNPEKAYQLLEMDYYLEVVDIRDYVGRSTMLLPLFMPPKLSPASPSNVKFLPECMGHPKMIANYRKFRERASKIGKARNLRMV